MIIRDSIPEANESKDCILFIKNKSINANKINAIQMMGIAFFTEFIDIIK